MNLTSSRTAVPLLFCTKHKARRMPGFVFDRLVLSPGIEPGSQVPQTCILSIKLRERRLSGLRQCPVAYIKTREIPARGL